MRLIRVFLFPVIAATLMFGWTAVIPIDAHADSSCESPPRVAYFARHARKVGPDGAGIQIPVGFDQAVALAAALESEGITHIYVTDILRTQQTADPLAERLSMEPIEIPRAQSEKQVDALCGHDSDDRVLVVGHARRLSRILADLGLENAVFRYCVLYRIDFDTMEMESSKYCEDSATG